MISLFDSGAPEPCPAPFNLAAYALARAEVTLDQIALQVVRLTGAERWSYASLVAAIRGTGTGLLSMGLKPGDRILMRLGNTVEFPILFLGAISVGLVPVPTSSQLSQPEVTRIAAEIAPALIAADDGISLPRTPACPVIGAEALRGLRSLPPCDWAMGDPGRLAYIIYTSGSSGSPRAVMHAHRAVWARRMMWQGWYGMTAADRILHAGAFNWTYTLGTGLLDPWAIGATALIPGDGTPAQSLPLLLKRFDATIFAAAPGVYRQILRAPVPALPKLRHGISAGEKLPDTLREAWTAATGTAVHEAFGMSECSTFISASPDRPAQQGSSGYPQPGRRIAVLGEDAQPVPVGEPGVLAVSRRDPGLFLGYLGAKAETEAMFRGDWFCTGDMASMAEDGAISYLGRNDDMMNAGGYRVSPIEVERALSAHPAIHDCAACEVTVKRDTTVIACFYTSDETLNQSELEAFAASRLARYKQPRMFVRVETLPRGANGKLARRILRQEYEASHGSA